ncbi:hypothetical protein [Rhizobium leguminosarum]|uniref:hypothetical protein n=1 Tax=Rhizobium leguminosarum TaxID=384 RepID=UPI001037409A|nr:hypothetical protein [Rhizobium leguminosarum]TBF85829.1 hypothetical protein ELG85_37035 [Rhizobium leguminosarum]
MLTTLLVYVSALVAALAILDFLVSDKQKERLSDVVLRIWNRLDEMKQFSLLDVIRRPAVRRAAIVVATVLANCISWYLFVNFWGLHAVFSSVSDIVPFVIAALLGLSLGVAMLNVMFRAKKLWWLALVSTIFFIVPASLSVATIGLDFYFSSLVRQNMEYIFLYEIYMYTSDLLAFLTFTTFLFWIIPAILFIVVYGSIFLLLVSEFLVRRVAEYPKGPILAASALLGGLATLLSKLGY